jgi:hypothetical protein
MAETNLWSWLRPYCPRGHYVRIENGEVGPGTPDVSFCVSRTEGWIELKDARSKTAKIPFPNPDVGLHKSQIRWITERQRNGGNVWICARVGKLILFIPGVYCNVFNGADLKRLRFFAKLEMDMSDPAPSLRKLKQLLEKKQ